MKNNDFLWNEFLSRLIINHDEFTFLYNDKTIDISFAYKEKKLITALSYGNKNDGYVWKDYITPEDLLKDKIFDGKTLQEVWNDLE